jgi:hypothetical protein
MRGFLCTLCVVFLLAFGAVANAGGPNPYAPAPNAHGAKPTLPPGLSYFCDWSNYWEPCFAEDQSVSPERLRTIGAQSTVSGYALRAQVNPGDNPVPNPDGTIHERSELSIMLDSSGNPIDEDQGSGTQYYAISVKLPTSWTPPTGTPAGGEWGIFMQLHSPDSYNSSPPFAFDATNGFSIALYGGDVTTLQGGPKNYPLSNSALNLGVWVDFILAIKWSAYSDGAIQVWRQDGNSGAGFSSVLNLTGIATLQSSAGQVGPHYWKTGFYRSSSAFNSNLVIGPIARGTSFGAVADSAFP